MRTSSVSARDAAPPPSSARRSGGAAFGVLAALRVLGLVLAFGAVPSVAFLPPVKAGLERLLEWTHALGGWGVLVLAAAYVPASVLLVPGSLLTLGAGFVGGLLLGTIAVSIGSTLGASAAFLVGRTLARRRVTAWVARRPRLRALDRAIEQHGFRIVLLLRLSPLFPFNVLNYALSVSSISFGRFFLATWIGTLPGTVLYVYLGSAAQSLSELSSGGAATAGLTAVRGLGLLVTIVVAVLVARTARRAIREAAPGVEEGRPEEATAPGKTASPEETTDRDETARAPGPARRAA